MDDERRSESAEQTALSAQRDWIRPVAEGLGRAARAVTDGLDQLRSDVETVGSPRGSADERTYDVPALCASLDRLLTDHRDAGYAQLHTNDAFWQLVADLGAARRRMGRGHASRGTHAPEDASAASGHERAAKKSSAPDQDGGSRAEQGAKQPRTKPNRNKTKES